MNIFRGLSEFKQLKNAVVTIGTFDGLHVGHQKILQRLAEVARNCNGETVLITFWPHPRYVLNPNGETFHLLTSIEEKSEILKNFGIDHLVIIPFTREFSNLTSREFVKDILINIIGTKKLVIGYDHRFGKDRAGSFEELKREAPRYGFEVEEIPEQDIDHIAVSSTKIRNALNVGDIEIANRYLGRKYCLSGIVVKGEGLGRKIGYPTANINPNFEHKLVPGDGIYAVKVGRDDKMFNGMLNIGYRPTVDGKHRVIEVNIFDFDEDIYGEMITLYFFKKTRSEIKFNSVEELKEQLHSDKKEIRNILKKR